MKKIITLSMLTFGTVIFAQKLTSKDFNKELTTIIWGEEEANTMEESILDFYNCILKKHPKKFIKNHYPEITPTKVFYAQKEEERSITDYSLMWNSGGGDYQRRIAIQKYFPKCIKKSDIDW